MDMQEESLPPFDASLFPRVPVQRWHSVGRRSDLRPLSQSRGHKVLLTIGLGIAVLVIGGGGTLWFASRDGAGAERVPVAQDGEVARITPVVSSPNPAAAPSTPVAPAAPEFHVVQTGEVLSTIASKYNTTVAVLAELNEIEDVNEIRVGQRIRLVPEEQ